MSSIRWENDRLIFRVRGKAEDVGYAKIDEASNKWSVFFKDSSGIMLGNVAHVRLVEEFSSLQEAQIKSFETSLFRYFSSVWHENYRLSKSS